MSLASCRLLFLCLCWLDHKGFSKQTVINHLGNIYLFASYFVYSEPLKKLDEATENDVYGFLADWFPRKALWASVRSVQTYCASFKKFFQWMGETQGLSDGAFLSLSYPQLVTANTHETTAETGGQRPDQTAKGYDSAESRPARQRREQSRNAQPDR
jgi:site-specific recombinase XerD